MTVARHRRPSPIPTEVSRLNDVPPMPQHARVYATIRDMGSIEQPVARTQFTDVMGDTLTLDLHPAVAIDLALQLLTFVQQTGLDPARP